MFEVARYTPKSLLACMLASTFLATVGLPSLADAQTKKVPTQRIIVPEEGEAEIPNDALPSLELKQKDTEEEEEPETAKETPEEDGPPPPVLRDISKLPKPVQQMHARILEVAKKGKIEDLRQLLAKGSEPTTLSIGGLEGDPIDFMKETSGDDDGYEILAILIEVLEAGFVHLDNDTDEEVYVWPYFYAHPLAKLTPEQKVELFRILTAGDVQDSENFGSYIFYRAGIKPDGSWAFFVAGD